MSRKHVLVQDILSFLPVRSQNQRPDGQERQCGRRMYNIALG